MAKMSNTENLPGNSAGEGLKANTASEQSIYLPETEKLLDELAWIIFDYFIRNNASNESEQNKEE